MEKKVKFQLIFEKYLFPTLRKELMNKYNSIPPKEGRAIAIAHHHLLNQTMSVKKILKELIKAGFNSEELTDFLNDL